MTTCRQFFTLALVAVFVSHGFAPSLSLAGTVDAGGSGSSDSLSGNPQASEFWSYQAPIKPVPPNVRNTAWVHTDIDRFILARLEREGLSPVRDAAKTALVRRAYYDLIGLPPTPEQIDEFTRDESPDAFARLIDRLLQQPQFGERWGRHWLDVARFGESVTLRGLIFKEAWRYRDYVIDAFNRDLPYDRFIREQIAGDLLPAATLEERQRQLIATTFLVLGNTNLEEQDKAQLRMDVIDEQLDTIGKAFLGQTIGCARCHDHKFDPIPTRDYYAMAGILRNSKSLIDANVSSWVEVPLPVEPELEAKLQAHEAQVEAQKAAIKSVKERIAALQRRAGGAPPAVVAASQFPGLVLDDSQAKRVGDWQHSQYSGRYIGDGYLHDRNTGKGEKTLTFHPDLPKPGRYEIRLAYDPGDSRARSVPVTVLSADGEMTVHINQREIPPLDGRFVSLGQFRFEQNGQGYVLIGNEGTDGHVIVDAVQFISLEALDGAVAALSSEAASANQAGRAKDKQDLEIATANLKQLEAELKQLNERGPKRPMVMSVKEIDEIAGIRVHIRGSVHRLGEPVERGFLSVASFDGAPAVPPSASGRVELGHWLSNPSNPLTARVMVNRVWLWLFGAGLVGTPDNFGSTGEPPLHAELLDYLAVSFVENDWSIKQLIRQIMLSRAYQLSTEPSDAALAADPENRWHWRMNRRRLDAEAIRDTMLFVSGELKLDMGGSTIKSGTNADYGYIDADTRRSVYIPVLRNALPELFEAFDFADPSMVSGRRNTSTVAPQALYLMNHPFVFERAKHAAERLLQKPLNRRERVVLAYRLTLGREPSPGELNIGLRHLDESDAVEDWTQLIQALFASIDFRYLN